MPRMPKYLKEEWAFFLDERGRKKYNELYMKCERSCKQSFRAAVIQCSYYLSKGEQDNDRLSEQHSQQSWKSSRQARLYPKEVRWLWYPYIPFGKVTLLQGDPGDGKSKLMLSLAALLSKGAPLPFADEDESGEPMTIIYQTTEDDADDTVVPRFNSAGGDGDRLIFIKEDEKSLTFGDDRIREAVEKYNAKLLILDPMSSYIGDTCSMNNANETRAEFNHLIAVAKDTGCAIVIIAHMNKAKDTSPLYRTNGSIDIAGAARSILAVTRTANKQNPAERYLVQVKSNLAPMGSAILFEVADKGVNFLDELSAEDTFFGTGLCWRLKNRLRMGRKSRTRTTCLFD